MELKKQSLYLEIYPVGLWRYESNSTTIQEGLGLTWGPTLLSKLLITLYPDFAQIVADPFVLLQMNFDKMLFLNKVV